MKKHKNNTIATPRKRAAGRGTRMTGRSLTTAGKQAKRTGAGKKGGKKFQQPEKSLLLWAR